MPIKPQNFWNFSLNLYSREDVADACLQLQEEYQLDVNLILFCYWYGSRFGVIEAKLLSQVIDFSLQWRSHVVQPLRNTRNWLKLNEEDSEQIRELRERIKAGELAAEKHQQDRIAEFVSDSNNSSEEQAGRQACDKNIDKLLQGVALERDSKIAALLATVSSAHQQN
ncbi:MAG: TIGR02444 family protein [Pseudohongiellaceae bacterium]